MEYKEINGVRTFAPESKKALIEYAATGKKILIAVNADKILHATQASREIINRNVGYPDGIGAVMTLKQKGVKNVVKIPGCELWLDIIATYYKKKSFYLIGGKELVIRETVSKLIRQFPEIKILNYRNGYIKSKKEKQALITDISEKQPDIVFVAMGSPKQELLMEEIQKNHPALYQGLGGSFDVYTGRVKRAPDWWIKNNLEGAFRLLKQPSKTNRYIKALPFWWNLIFKKY